VSLLGLLAMLLVLGTIIDAAIIVGAGIIIAGTGAIAGFVGIMIVSVVDHNSWCSFHWLLVMLLSYW